MTDRFKGLTVVLDRDIREDDAEYIIKAISMIKGVQSVHGNVSTSDDFIVQTRTKTEVIKKLYSFIEEINKL